MLEHQKAILKAVANNIDLFRKELIKSLIWLSDREISLLRKWVREKFKQTHNDVMNEVFLAIPV